MSMKYPLFALLTLLPLASAAETDVMERLKFSATEYLIYADQLQKLDQSACGQGAGTQFSLETARSQVLKPLNEDDRQAMEQYLDSPPLRNLLEENTQGIAALLGVQDLTRAPNALTDAQRQTCVEYRLIFQHNLEATAEDLNALWQAYGNH